MSRKFERASQAAETPLPEARNNDAWQQSSDADGDADPYGSQASCSSVVDVDLGCEEGVLVAEQGPALRTLELPDSLPPVPGCLNDDPEDTEDMLR